jgi:hypothetical protein
MDPPIVKVPEKSCAMESPVPFKRTAREWVFEVV